MNVMKEAHKWARDNRENFGSYREALRQGLIRKHAEKKETVEMPERELVAKKIRDKHDLTFVVRGDKKGFSCNKKISQKDVELLKEYRPEITAILEKEQEEKVDAEEAKIQKEIEEYLASSPVLKRMLVVETGELLDKKYYLCTMAKGEKGYSVPPVGNGRIYNRVNLSGETATTKGLAKAEGTPLGWDATMWEISPAEENAIIAESNILAEEMRVAAEEREERKQKQEAEVFEKMYGHLKGMSIDEIRKREREYDNIHNEGGEGYNPYRV